MVTAVRKSYQVHRIVHSKGSARSMMLLPWSRALRLMSKVYRHVDPEFRMLVMRTNWQSTARRSIMVLDFKRDPALHGSKRFADRAIPLCLVLKTQQALIILYPFFSPH